MFTIARARANCLLFFSSASLLLPSFLTLPPLSLSLPPSPSSSGGGFLQFPLAAARGAWKKTAFFKNVLFIFFPVDFSWKYHFIQLRSSWGIATSMWRYNLTKIRYFSESTLQEQVLFFSPPTVLPPNLSPILPLFIKILLYSTSQGLPSLGFKMKKKKVSAFPVNSYESFGTLDRNFEIYLASIVEEIVFPTDNSIW